MLSVRADRIEHARTAMGDEFRGHSTKWSTADVAGEWHANRKERQGIAALPEPAA